jgi:hypothetical protein
MKIRDGKCMQHVRGRIKKPTALFLHAEVCIHRSGDTFLLFTREYTVCTLIVIKNNPKKTYDKVLVDHESCADRRQLWGYQE